MNQASDVWQALTPLLQGNTSGSALKLLGIFIKSLDDDLGNTLRGIEENTAKLIHAKLKTGQDLLADAKVVWSDEMKRVHFLDEARRAFIEASGVSRILCKRSKINVYQETGLWHGRKKNPIELMS